MYLDGKHIKSISLVPGGGIAKSYKFNPTEDCLFSIATTAVAVLTASGTVLWVSAGSVEH